MMEDADTRPHSGETFTLRQPIRFTHCDPAGIVFFPRFFDMIQAAVEDWFTYGLGVDFAGFIENGFGTPTARTECDFLLPCRLGEFLDITVRLTKLGRSSVHLAFSGRVAGEERLRARSVLVLFSLASRKTVPIEGDLRRRMERYLDVCGGPAN